MRRFSAYLSRLLIGSFLVYTVSVFPALSEDREIVIDSLQLLPTVEGATIEIRSNRPFAFVTYTLVNPDRLVVDPVEPDLESTLPEFQAISSGLIRSWHLIRVAGKGRSGGVDYFSFELTQPAEHRLESNASVLVIRVRPKQQLILPPGPGSVMELPTTVHSPAKLTLTAALSPEPIPPPAAPAEIPDPAASAKFLSGEVPPTGGAASKVATPPPDLFSDGKSALTGRSHPMGGGMKSGGGASFDTVLQYGLGRHRPVRIARAEVELAQMKVREARRALYPAATLKASWTDGTASNVDFREVNTGLQVEQPLYYSGRLMETYRQSLVNLQVAEKKQSKVKADFALEIGQAYFQLIGAQATLDTQRGVVEEAEEFLQRTTARREKELLTRLELLNVQAQVNQAKFQRSTAENDLVLARIKFLQKLNLGAQAIVEVPSQFPPASGSPVDLEEGLRLSAQYRPDIQVNSLLVQFHEFEERIAREKGKLKVDLSGFIGSSGSAFETEPLDLGEDYFIGIKATEALGLHGATVSTTTTKTSPRLGQTTRTDSTVYSGELGILNQLQGMSEIQQAVVNLEKARHDLEETKATVFQEVQEAYVSTKKARLQLEYAKQKIIFRQEQVKILNAQASVNEALPSQVLEAMLRLAEERVGEVQAQTNYHVALAKLNKAIGLPGHYR